MIDLFNETLQSLVLIYFVLFGSSHNSSARSISPNLKTIRDAQSYEFLPSITKKEVKKY